MKKLFTTSFLALIACFMFQTAAFAQNDIENVKLGVGVAYDGEIENAGLQANAVFRLSEKFGVSPNITFYFLDDDEGIIDSYIAFNVDGHYMLVTDPDYHVYALGGLNLTSIGFEDFDPPAGVDYDDSETELGLNLGIGGEYHLEGFSLFSDLKYVIGDLDRVVLAVGARFSI